MMQIQSHRSLAPVLVATAALMLASTAAFAGDPAGNNGTVKVAGTVMDSIPDNEPHQGCVFDVQFFGYDEGALSASATFEVIRPEGDVVVLEDTHVFIGGDPASGAGTPSGIDATESYDLNEVLAPFAAGGNPNQGVHVRLTVRAMGSIGANTKHKTFWAEGCEFQNQET